MLHQKVQAFITKQELFATTDRLLVAISAGIDSVVMLHLLLELGYQPGLIHCNFQLRAEASDLDEAFILNLAKQHQLPVFTQRFETATEAKKQCVSIQMMARDQRYAYFEIIRKKHQYDYILTAHHLDDKLETFLMNFIRGTGLTGLQSIPAINGVIRRPLLAINRQEIVDYQQQNEINYREDESNASDKYTRNSLRHHVLPHLYELAPQLPNIAQQNFDHLKQMHLLYQMQIDQLKDEFITITNQGFELDLEGIRNHPSKETVLWECLKGYGFDQEQLRQVLEAKQGTVLQVKDRTALITKEKLILEKASNNEEIFHWQEDENTILIDENKRLEKSIIAPPEFLKTPSSKIYVNKDKLVFPLTIRYWKAGDFFHPFGMKGQRQKLQDFFINNKINRLDRSKVHLLVNGDGAIIWIVGHRMDDRFRLQNKVNEVMVFSSVEMV